MYALIGVLEYMNISQKTRFTNWPNNVPDCGPVRHRKIRWSDIDK